MLTGVQMSTRRVREHTNTTVHQYDVHRYNACSHRTWVPVCLAKSLCHLVNETQFPNS